MSWICISLLKIIRVLTEFRNKQNTKLFEFISLNPKVMLTAVIPRVENVLFKHESNVYTLDLTSTSPFSNFLGPASFVHFLWVGKGGTNAASKDLVASHFLWQMLLHWLFHVKECVEQKLHYCLTAMIVYVILSNVDKKHLKWERTQ